MAPRGLDDQPVEGDDLERGRRRGRQRAAHLAQHGGAFLGGEHRRLAGMDADGDHQPVDKPAGMAHDIDMAEGDGIEDCGYQTRTRSS